MCGDAQICLKLARGGDQILDMLERGVAAKLFDVAAVRFGNAPKPRRIDDKFAAFVDDVPETIARLTSQPKIFVMLVKDGDDAFIATTGVPDVDLAAHFGRFA